jgi:hypothetical protein
VLLEVESRNHIAPGIVQGPSRFPPKFDINTEKFLEEGDRLTDPNPGTFMSLFTALFLLNSPSDLLGVEDSGGCS